jgi:two-component system, OmpR family, phosphate regulon response regulator OmpR
MTCARTPLLYIVQSPESSRPLGDYLQKNGFRQVSMAGAEDLFRLKQEKRPDLVLMDVDLPGLSGLEACRRLRNEGDHVPVVLVAAVPDESDHVLGLELGADDYLDRPLSSREMLARVRAILRRGRLATPPADAARPSIQVGSFRFDTSSRSLHRGSEVRVLSPVEHSMLAELARLPSVPVSRERLLEVSRESADGTLLRAVDASIMRLRRIVEPDPARPRLIRTVRHQGYMFVPAVSA